MMLTSSSQYLRPDYLTPLPTTLDAKKSPLALLAQTCSQIGTDVSKSTLLQNSDKKSNKTESFKEKNVSKLPENIHKTSSESDDVSSAREKSSLPEESFSLNSNGIRARTPIHFRSTTDGDSSSRQSIDSPSIFLSTTELKSSYGEGTTEKTNILEKLNERTSPNAPSSSGSKTGFIQNNLTSSSDPTIKDLPLGMFKPGVPTSSSFLGYPVSGFPLHVDLMTSSMISQHHILKTAGLSSYFGYGSIKSQESLQSVCRDPYCTGCSVSSHILGSTSGAKAMSCSAGCTQCEHTKPLTSTGYIGHNPSVAAYAHAQLAAMAAVSNLPYVCNWISGDAAYCGKRFASAEELFAHLRTHTSGAIADSNNSLSLLNSPGLSPNHSVLHRTYPTPPLSPLPTSRYHPYNKPSLRPSLNSPSLSGFPLTHHSLNPYLSPYSLYAPRLGSTPGMHP